jgi:hypothetical protein
MGKDESGRQTTALGMANEASRAESCEKIKKSILRKKPFFCNMVCPVKKIAPTKTLDTAF